MEALGCEDVNNLLGNELWGGAQAEARRLLLLNEAISTPNTLVKGLTAGVWTSMGLKAWEKLPLLSKLVSAIYAYGVTLLLCKHR